MGAIGRRAPGIGLGGTATRPWRAAVRLLLGAAALLVGAAAVADPAAAASSADEPRTALVIGNGAYSWAALTNPPHDASDMAEALGSLGFEVTLATDLDRSAMKRAIAEFGDTLERRGGVGLFYFAGHGAQVDGWNYLIPIDAPIQSERDVDIEAVRVDELMASLAGARNRMNIVVLDACRNNPFASKTRSAHRGLAFMTAPAETLIAYSTAPGAVAADGEGRNGLYTRALLGAMREPGREIYDVFRETRRAVKQASGNRQEPWESSSLTGRFYFVPTPAGNRSTDDGRLALGDLEREADRLRVEASSEDAYLVAMGEDFARAEQFAAEAPSADLASRAWQRFLDSYPEDVASSSRDDVLRDRAARQLAAAERRAEIEAFSGAVPMVDVPAGSYLRGNRQPDSLQEYAIDRTEVTVASYGECVAAGQCSPPSARGDHCTYGRPGLERHPVNCVDWYQAKAYCTWRGARLPSEREWEKAARGVDGRLYPWGSDWSDRLANTSGDKDGDRYTAEVGSHPEGAAPSGALDMAGNVFEWTADAYGSGLNHRVIRGGSWKHGKQHARTSNRSWAEPTTGTEQIGFRCAR